MKTCTDCGQSKPDFEYYSKPSYKCRECKRIRGRARYAPIKAAVKDKRLATYRDGLKQCRLCKNFKPVTEYRPHRDHWDRLEHECKSCHSKNYKKAYRANPEKSRAHGKLYYQRHKEQILEKNKKWRKDNLDKSHAIWHRYSASKKAAGGKFTKEQWQALVSHYCPDGKCLACQKKRKLQKEHVIPVSKGGSSFISNIQPICASCNYAKAQNATDYRPDEGEFAQSLM